MDKLIETLEEVLELNQDPSLEQKLRHCLLLSKGLDHYLVDHTSPPTALQKQIGDDTRAENWKKHFDEGLVSYVPSMGMMTDPYEGTFLRLIPQVSKAERVLEIGMFTGHSAVSFATSNHVKEVTCLELEPYFETFLKDRIKDAEVGKKISIRIGSALESLAELKEENKTFDLIFIDADKRNYINYYKFIMDNHLITKNGIFLIDNVIWRGKILPGNQDQIGQALDQFNKFVHNDPRVEQIILQIRDGVTLITMKE